MASLRRQRRKQCQGKIQHETEDLAWVAVRKTCPIKGRHSLTPYKCQFCGKYHIGHKKILSKRRT